MRTMKHLAIAAMTASALALAGCGGGGSSSNGPVSSTTDTPPVAAAPTPFMEAQTAIAAATTPEAAQAAYDKASKDAGVTAPQLATLREARDARVDALNMVAAAAARQMLVTAAMCDAATAECVAAHDALIAALQADVDALADNEDATNAQQTDAQMALDEAQDARDAVAMALADFDRTTETGMKVGEAVDAANGLEDERSAEDIATAEEAIAAAKMAIGEDDDSHDERILMAETAVARAKERNAVDMAIMDARSAIEGLAADADGDAVAAVQTQLTAAKMAVDENEHLTDAEEAGHTETIALLQVTVTQAQARVEADAEKMRMAEAEEERKRNEANAATAAKLYAAISPASGDGSTETADARFAEINPVSEDDPTPFVSVNPGGPLETADEANSGSLNLDKDATVADHRGWKGNRYVEKDDDGNVIKEAIVYSDESPTKGPKFNSGEGTGNVGFALDANTGAVTIDGNDLNLGARIASPRFVHTSGTIEFEFPEGNPKQEAAIVIPGSYYGVAGSYTCVPGANACEVTKATGVGYTLGGDGTWTFKPTDPNVRVTEGADTLYAVYGWWLSKPAGNGGWTASAFADYYGTPAAITGLNTLNGSATYTGGAAGKYALSSSTGGENEAGHFTATATLEADFDTDMITGTVDNFMGVGGAKDWSVALQKSGFSATGQILGADGANDSTPMKTVWTKDGTAAAASGQWKGNFREVGVGDVPGGVPAVVTGDFYSEFGNSGKMVGAFGAKTE